MKVKRTRLCPSCGSIQRVGYPCSVCRYPICEEKKQEPLKRCPDCDTMIPADGICPWCGNDNRSG